jgi:hypothetical protein
MARPLRLEFPGAVYHLTSRGNARQDIVVDDRDRSQLLSLLAHVVDRYGWLCHAYCLMDNHYHLLVETPQPNLSLGMRQLNAAIGALTVMSGLSRCLSNPPVKLLLDSCVWWRRCSLKLQGTMSSGRMRSWPRVYQEGRISSLDKDFGELAVVRGQAHAWIIRLPILPAFQQAPTCLMVLTRYGAELQAGAILTVEPGRVRVRPAALYPESS